VLQPRQRGKLAWGTEDKEHAMSGLNSRIAAIGIDIGKNSFHVEGQDERGAIVLRQKWSRGQVEVRLFAVNFPSLEMINSGFSMRPHRIGLNSNLLARRSRRLIEAHLKRPLPVPSQMATAPNPDSHQLMGDHRLLSSDTAVTKPGPDIYLFKSNGLKRR
jgi:hypothetical protein